MNLWDSTHCVTTGTFPESDADVRRRQEGRRELRRMGIRDRDILRMALAARKENDRMRRILTEMILNEARGK
jgi:hypothetical protein